VRGGEHRAELDNGARCGRRASCAANPRASGLSAAPVTTVSESSTRGVPRGTLGRMSSDMDTDLPVSELDRSALLEVVFDVDREGRGCLRPRVLGLVATKNGSDGCKPRIPVWPVDPRRTGRCGRRTLNCRRRRARGEEFGHFVVE
jgi:hypothetical protein